MSEHSGDHAKSDDANVQKVLKHMEGIVVFASRNKGYVFGGFVRDVVVPTINGNVINVLPKDVDLYFEDEGSATKFIGFCNGLGYTLTRESGSSSEVERNSASESKVFTISRTMYKVSHNGGRHV